MNIFKKTYLILFLFVFSTITGQTVKCTFCGKDIIGEYIVVEGKTFHQNHFKCVNCNKQIKGNYSKKNGRYYAQKCFTKLYALKCSICSDPIDGEYLIDDFGLKFHKYHENELKICDNCNRLIV